MGRISRAGIRLRKTKGFAGFSGKQKNQLISNCCFGRKKGRIELKSAEWIHPLFEEPLHFHLKLDLNPLLRLSNWK